MRRFALGLFLTCLTGGAFANFTCAIHLSKGKCWGAHEVTVKVASSTWPDIVTTIKLAKDKFSAQKDISCKPMDSIVTTATFTPPIWEGDVGKTYRQKKQWIIPASLPEGSEKYVIQICFPKNYDGVPLPMGDIRKCKCEFNDPEDK